MQKGQCILSEAAVSIGMLTTSCNLVFQMYDVK